MKKSGLYFFLLWNFNLAYSAYVNALSIHNGACIKTKIPSFTNSPSTASELVKWSQEALIDDNFSKGWCSQESTTFPIQFVVELSEKYLLHKIVFGNAGEAYKGISCKTIQIETSVISGTEGYSILKVFELTENQFLQEYTINPAECRWMRITILANHGHPKFTELMEIQAMGEYSKTSLISLPIEGVWDSNWDWVSVTKNANGVYYGCYKYNRGTLYAGEVKRRVFEFEWEEKIINRKGWARLVINEEGTILRGTWGFNNDRNRFGIWEFTLKTNVPNPCWNEEEVKLRIPEPGSYQIPMEEISNPPLELTIEVFDKNTGKILTNTSLEVLKSGSVLQTLIANKPNVLLEGEYAIRVHQKGYFYSEINYLKFSTSQVLKVNLQPIQIGEKVILQHVLFKQGKAELVIPENEELNQLAQLLKDNPTLRLELSGHTDNQGNLDDNVTLSKERAELIRKELIRKGISESRLVSIGYGGALPIADNTKEETRKLNRRVEAKVLNF
jgi:outer membrane protein OmpA-like peptidoglycan-associated protein